MQCCCMGEHPTCTLPSFCCKVHEHMRTTSALVHERRRARQDALPPTCRFMKARWPSHDLTEGPMKATVTCDKRLPTPHGTHKTITTAPHDKFEVLTHPKTTQKETVQHGAFSGKRPTGYTPHENIILSCNLIRYAVQAAVVTAAQVRCMHVFCCSSSAAAAGHTRGAAAPAGSCSRTAAAMLAKQCLFLPYVLT